MDDLIPIGRFARLSGLTIGALRHYDELDLLRPADVDPARATGATDPSSWRTHARSRACASSRFRSTRSVLHHVSGVVDRKEPIVAKPPSPPELDPATRR